MHPYGWGWERPASYQNLIIAFADEDRNRHGLPGGCAYRRCYWRELESAPRGP
jgi:hypothetical protein